jgi:hypothetical protein
MLLLFPIPSAALEKAHEVTAVAACSHNWEYAYTFIEYNDVSATVCQKQTNKYSVCSKCGDIKIDVTFTNGSHISVMYDATCSGTVHTYYYHCRNCGRFIKTTTQPCPNPGNCPGLPL